MEIKKLSKIERGKNRMKGINLKEKKDRKKLQKK